MSLSLSQLRTRVRDEVGGESTFYDDAFVDDAIEETLHDLGEQILVIGRRVLTLRKGVNFYGINFPDIMKASIRAYYADTSEPMEVTSIQKLDAQFGPWWQSTATIRPEYIFSLGINMLGVYPHAGNEGLQVIIEYPRSPNMPLTPSEIIELPDHLEDEILMGSVQWLKFASSDPRFLDAMRQRPDYTVGRDEVGSLTDKDNRWRL